MALGLKFIRNLVWLGVLVTLFATSLYATSAAAEVNSHEISEYSKDFHVSVEAASEALDTQAKAIEGGIVGDLEDRLRDKYAGIWFDNVTGEYVVPVLPGASRAAVVSEFAQDGLGAAEFRISRAQASWEELEAAQRRLGRPLLQPMREGLIQTSLDPRTNAVVVKQADGAGAEDRAEVQSLIASAPVEVEVRASKVEDLGGRLEACIDPYCGSTLRGGVRIFDPSDTTRPCTAGFPALGSDGSRYLLTAGHCVRHEHQGIPNFLNWSSKNEWEQTYPIGSVAQAEYPGGDWAKINANGSAWDNGSWRSEVVYWGTPILSGSAVVGKTAMVNPEYPITGEAASVIGNYACHSGIVTGTTCGPITGVNGSFTQATLTVYGVNEMANACSSPGDSGGPVFFANKALGLHHSSLTEKTCGDTLVYIDIQKATSALGVHIAPPPPPAPATEEDDDSPGPRVAAQSNGIIDSFYRTPSGELGHDWWGPSTGWTHEVRAASIAPSSVPHVLNHENGIVDVFYRTTSNELGHDWWGPSTGWTHEVRAVSLASDPHAVSNPNGVVDIFYRTPSNELGHDWWGPSTGWTHEVRAASLASDPHPVMQENGIVNVFYRTPEGDLGNDWWGPSTGWTHEVRPGPLASDPHPIVQENGVVDVFYRTPDSQLGHDSWTPTAGWTHEVRPGPLASDPHPAAVGNGAVNIFYRTTAGNLGNDWWTPATGWAHEIKSATVAARPPVVSTGSATSPTYEGATVNATVNPEGALTSYYFEYGLTTSYGSKQPASAQDIGSGYGTLALSQALAGLSEGTTYHYRVVATSAEGTSKGADKTLTTTMPTVAFQASNKELWTYSTPGSGKATGLGMLSGTSPAIAASPGGGYAAAFQANNNELWTYSSAGTWKGTGFAVKAATSPSIAVMADGSYRVAFEATNNELWVYSSATGQKTATGLGMLAGTSPAITANSSTGFKVAFQANNNELWTYTPTGGGKAAAVSMLAGTGPAIG